MPHFGRHAQQRTARALKAEAARLGFDACGIATAEPLDEEARRLEQWLLEGRHGTMHWMERHFDKRIDPTRLVPGSESVISVLHNYYQPDTQHDESATTGKISRYAWGDDYHDVLKERLYLLLHWLEEHVGQSVHGRAFVDSAPVLDKAWAARSGLGWQGKHSNLLNRDMGSFFFIGEIIVDVPLPADRLPGLSPAGRRDPPPLAPVASDEIVHPLGAALVADGVERGFVEAGRQRAATPDVLDCRPLPRLALAVAIAALGGRLPTHAADRRVGGDGIDERRGLGGGAGTLQPAQVGQRVVEQLRPALREAPDVVGDPRSAGHRRLGGCQRLLRLGNTALRLLDDVLQALHAEEHGNVVPCRVEREREPLELGPLLVGVDVTGDTGQVLEHRREVAGGVAAVGEDRLEISGQRRPGGAGGPRQRRAVDDHRFALRPLELDGACDVAEALLGSGRHRADHCEREQKHEHASHRRPPVDFSRNFTLLL